MAKITRRLTIKLTPISKGNYAMTVQDGTTRAEDGSRITESVLTSDAFLKGSIPDAFAEAFRAFDGSLKDVDPGELFAETKTAKPKIDG